MRFKLCEVKFDLKYECHQNPSKRCFIMILGCFDECQIDLKIDLIMYEPHYVKFFFFEPPA